MKTWYSAAELAVLRLPDWPSTRFGVQKRCEAEGRESRTVAGKLGGGKAGLSLEYRLSNDEMAALVALQTARDNKATQALMAVDQTQPPAVVAPSQLADWQRQCAEARLVLVREVQQRMKAGGKKTAALQSVVDDASAGVLAAHLQGFVSIANARAGDDRAISRRSLFEWVGLVEQAEQQKQSAVALLAPKPRAQKIPAWAGALLKVWGQPQKPNLTTVLDMLPQFLPAGVECPSYSQAYRFLSEKVGNVEREKGRMGSRSLKNIQPFIRRDTTILQPSDVYTADGHCFDAEVAHPSHGRPFRPEITAVVDVATRVMVGWSLDLAESGWAVLDAIRMSATHYGVPAVFYVDNGSGYKNDLMKNEGLGLLARLPSEAADNMRDFYELLSQRHFQLAIGKFITPEEGDPIKKIGLRGNRKGFDMNKYLADHLENGGDAGEAVVALMNRQLSKTPNYVRLQNEIIALEKSGGNPDLLKSKKAAQQMVASGVFGNIFHNMQSGSAVTTTFRGMQDPTELGFDAIRAATIDSEGTTAKVKSEKKQIEPAQAHALEQESILTTIKMYDTVKERLGDFEEGLTKSMQANQALAASAYAAAAALAVVAAAKIGGGLLGGGAAAAGGAAAGAAGGGLVAAARTVLRAPVGALAGSTVGRLALGTGVGLAGAGGWWLGSEVSDRLSDETNHNIGGTIATIMANLPDWMGGDTAREALNAEMASLTQEGNSKLDELIQLQKAQLDQRKSKNTPQPVVPYSPRSLMLGLSDAVNQEAQRGQPMWKP